jgi:glycosyltransferase involved in cell wall biosynthesis
MPEALARFGESTGRARLASRGLALATAAGAVRGYARALAAHAAAVAPSVVHSNGLKLHMLAAHALPRELPLVWHMHEYVSPRPLTRSLLRRLRHRPRVLVANSRSVAADLALAVPGPPVETIYNAVDLAEFAPSGSTADLDRLSGLPPAPPDTLRVGLVATFGRWKGHLTFMQAIAALGPRRGIRAYIVGGPLYDTSGSQFSREELEREAHRMGIAERLGFTGFLPRPAAALRALDVVVHASIQPEPFGLVIAEAMACGRAVVYSAAGGATELAEEGVEALAHPPGDAAALAAAIARLAGAAELRTALGARARTAAMERFAPDACAGAFIDLYTRLGSGARAVAS